LIKSAGVVDFYALDTVVLITKNCVKCLSSWCCQKILILYPITFSSLSNASLCCQILTEGVETIIFALQLRRCDCDSIPVDSERDTVGVWSKYVRVLYYCIQK
jgi:hypothetical protein